MSFKSIRDILNSDILSETKDIGYSDRVLKSTRLEREIFRDIRNKTPEIKQFEEEGRPILSSIKQLINDVFQAFYTITPKMLDDKDLSPAAKKVNKVILTKLMTQEEYAAKKSVCEGYEIPALEATIVFMRELMPNLKDMVKSLSGGEDRINTMEQMAEQCSELLAELKQKLQSQSVSEKKTVSIANKLESKREQYSYLEKQADRAANMNRRKIQEAVAVALSKAVDSAETVKFVILSWGNYNDNMPKNEVNKKLRKVNVCC